MFFPKLSSSFSNLNFHRFFLFSCPKHTDFTNFFIFRSISSIDSTNFSFFRSISSINSSRSSVLFSNRNPSQFHVLRSRVSYSFLAASYPLTNFLFYHPMRTFLSNPQSPELPEKSSPDFPKSELWKSSEKSELLQLPGKPNILPEVKSRNSCSKSSNALQFLRNLFSNQPEELPNTHKTHFPELCSSSGSVLPFIISLFSSKLPKELQGAVWPWENPLLIVVSGPSGSGKSSIIRKLTEMRNNLKRVVSVTSREKRPWEVDGKDYVFVTKEEFLAMVDRGELLEYSIVYGDYKGIPRYKVMEHLAVGDDVVVMADVQGAAKLKSAYGRAAVFVFVVAESEGAAAKRLIDRKTESSDGLLVRMKAAKEEVIHIRFFDYVVVNVTHRLSATVALFNSIIYSEKAKLVARRKDRLFSL